MWWEPESETEFEVSRWISYASRLFLSERERRQIWGVGSYFTTTGTRPLVLINESVLDEASPIPRLLPLRLMPNEIRREFRLWEFPESTIFISVTEPEPLSSPPTIPVSTGGVLRCASTKMQGTIGPAVEGFDDYGNKYTGILTAGHVTPNGQGSDIEIVQQYRLSPPQYYHIGTVVHHSDPASHSSPGYDVSVIKLDANAYVAGFRTSGVAKIQSSLRQPLLCNMYGGVSGTFHHAGIIGALTTFGGQNRLWANCWLLLPSSVAVLGDSGSLVSVDSTSEAVGLLVGGSRAVNAPWYLSWYAQDLSSIQSMFLQSRNVSII